MSILCEAIHPEFKVYCGLERGHHSDHVGMVGKVPIVWPNDAQDEERIGKAILWMMIGVLIIGAMLAFACAAISAAG